MKGKMAVGKMTLFVSMLAVAGLMPLQASAECKFESTKAGNQQLTGNTSNQPFHSTSQSLPSP